MGSFALGEASRKCLANLSLQILDSLFGEMGGHSVLYEFHCCAVCQQAGRLHRRQIRTAHFMSCLWYEQVRNEVKWCPGPGHSHHPGEFFQ